MTFDYLPVRLCFTALDPVRFPPAMAGNVLRGALGLSGIPDAVFRPPRPVDGPSGLGDPPRPFVLRARDLNGREFPAGAGFDVAIHLFDLRPATLDAITAAFARAAAAGFGPGRGRAALRCVEAPASPVRLALDGSPGEAARVSVEFLSPTEFKPAGPPDFGVLLARARDRVSALRALYGAGPLDIDFRAMGERARAVRTVCREIRHVEVARRSARTGQVHSLGGFTGAIDYEGALGEFLPLLGAAEATGVGRHTVWGNGEIRVTAGA